MRNEMRQRMRQVMSDQNLPLAKAPEAAWDHAFLPIFDHRFSSMAETDVQPAWDVLWQPVWDELYPSASQDGRLLGC